MRVSKPGVLEKSRATPSLRQGHRPVSIREKKKSYARSQRGQISHSELLVTICCFTVAGEPYTVRMLFPLPFASKILPFDSPYFKTVSRVQSRKSVGKKNVKKASDALSLNLRVLP